MKCSWAGEVRNVSSWWPAPLIRRNPEILGICEGAKEDKSGWAAFLRHLVDRGLRGVQLIISDACRGLIESVAEFLPETRWQRCMVHFYRNVFSHVPATRSARSETVGTPSGRFLVCRLRIKTRRMSGALYP